MPIFTLFLHHRGLNFTQIASLSIVYSLVTIGGEIPTGYIGDRIGRRTSLLLGSVFMTLSIGGFALTSSYLGFVVLYIFWSLSLVFRSGSGDAWLYETLQQEIGELAEEEWHHPDIHLQWGEVGIEMWTHKIDGLHKTDFVMAARMDRIHEDYTPE
jgi:hypothetical protein